MMGSGSKIVALKRQHPVGVAHSIDKTDAKILELLQQNGRMQRNAVAEEVDLSVSAVSERMRKLEERGVIDGYHAVVDAKRLRFDITAFIRVSVDGSEHYEAFIDRVTGMDEVLELHSITGEGSHVMKVRTKNTTSLEGFLSDIQALPGVSGTTTSIVLSTFKETRSVPAEPMELYDYEDDD
jgi:Lrp/AsnC family leucine-responsive transcriptional regulator